MTKLKRCMKCGYTRKPLELAPQSECPRCGAIYAKVEAMLMPRNGQAAQRNQSSKSIKQPSPKQPSPQPNVPGPLAGITMPETPDGIDPFVEEISLLIRSRYGLIWIKSPEEERMLSLLKHVADALKLPLFTWSLTYGLCREGIAKAIYGSTDPKQALDHILVSGFPAVYAMQGLAPFLRDPAVTAKLLEAARIFGTNEGALILTGADLELPENLRLHLAQLSPPSPDRKTYAALLQNILRDVGARCSVCVELSEQDLNRLLNNLQGLTLIEAEKILTKAIVVDGKLNSNDIQHVVEAKKQLIERDGLLEYFPVEQTLADIAGMRNLKNWLEKRKTIITDPARAQAYGLNFPKGILLLGVPGSGKSLCAKAVAMEWALPLLKMDPSNLYNKYIGESERNFKRAMDTAEKMSPVILWIDEIEKAFAAGSGDNGTSERILGTFLSWMQERRGDVFVVATANNVDKLPPEFLRKGRFDEIFFVDLPDDEARLAIFSLHLSRRKQDPAHFDLQTLSDAARGFSGAEIEQVIVAGLYQACTDGSALDSGMLMEEIRRTKPLSVTRAEYLAATRAWAKERTVPA